MLLASQNVHLRAAGHSYYYCARAPAIALQRLVQRGPGMSARALRHVPCRASGGTDVAPARVKSVPSRKRPYAGSASPHVDGGAAHAGPTTAGPRSVKRLRPGAPTTVPSHVTRDGTARTAPSERRSAKLNRSAHAISSRVVSTAPSPARVPAPAPRPIIVLAHGAGGDSSSPRMRTWAQLLAPLGDVHTLDYPRTSLPVLEWLVGVGALV